MDRPSAIPSDQLWTACHPTKQLVQIPRLQRIQMSGTLVIVVVALRLPRQEMTSLTRRGALEHHPRLVLQVGAVSHGGHFGAEGVVEVTLVPCWRVVRVVGGMDGVGHVVVDGVEGEDRGDIGIRLRRNVRC